MPRKQHSMSMVCSMQVFCVRRFGLFFAFIVGLALGWCPDHAELGAAELQYPLSAVAADDGTIYIADRKLPGIWALKDGRLRVYYQASAKFRTPLNAVRCVALDKDGKLLVGDSATREIYRFETADRPVPLTGGFVGIPMSLAVKSDGTILVADLETHRVFELPHAGGEPQVVALVRAPRGLALDGDGRLHVLSTSSSRGQLLRVDEGDQLQPIVDGQPFDFPHNVVIDRRGRVYVSDGFGQCIWEIADGQPRKLVAGPPLVNPVGLSAYRDGLLVVDPRGAGLLMLSRDGKLEPVSIKAD